ncbi:MAG: SulP family inorganic anion transporter, partial [Planctomycetales bacterium]|nr:SulP family inorganic anion transporter [Planctomycetales bacterium]
NDNSSPTTERGMNLKSDFLASIVVFLVALPLCMGIAIASGAPVSAGLITGIVGGLVAGSLAGCPLQVSGPAAGLAVIVYELIRQHGYETLGLIVLIAGVLQLAASLAGLGQWFRAVSPAVVKGMLAGIGILIFASQFHVMVDDAPKDSALANLVSIPSAVWKGVGIPEFPDRETREQRRAALQSIGELHRRQVHLQERLAEESPHGDQTVIGSAQSQDGGTQDFASLVAAQKELNDDLRSLQTRMQSASTAKAVVVGEAAVATLAAGEPVAAKQAQRAVVAELESLLASMKNHRFAAELGLLTICVILAWQTFSTKPLRVIPGPLVAVVLATAIAAFLALPVLYVEVPTNLWEEIHFPTWSLVSQVSWSDIIQASIFMAVVASAETLLSATAVDQLHQGPRTRYNKELLAQGAGNVVCGLLGALPMTGVIVRSSANVQAGARTRMSAILHAIWLLIFAVGLTWLLRMIPTSSLAAILVYTGYKLVNVKSIRELHKFGWGEVAIYAATAGSIVVFDLLTGVLIGVGLATAKLLHRFSQLGANLKIDSATGQARIQLRGAATFIRLPRLARTLEQVPRDAELHIDLEYLDYIDHACLDLLTTWAKQHQSTGGKLVLDWDALHARFRSNAPSELPKSATTAPAEDVQQRRSA